MSVATKASGRMLDPHQMRVSIGAIANAANKAAYQSTIIEGIRELFDREVLKAVIVSATSLSYDRG